MLWSYSATRSLALVLIAFSTTPIVQALQNASFLWQGVKSNDLLENTIVGECDSVQIVLEPLNSESALNATAPFYMISYEKGGIASTDFIGTDPNNLIWVVKHTQGSQALFNLVDSNGRSGGIGSVTVQTELILMYPATYINETCLLGGSSTNCHATTLTSAIRLASDVTQISTCDSVTVNITDGQKPYTVSVVPDIVGAVSENFTLGAEDDVFTFVNRIPTGNSFIITAVDSTGQWAWGTNAVSSIGSQDTSCTGKKSFGSQSSYSSNSTTSTDSSSGSSHQGLIIGVSVACGMVLALAIVLAFFFLHQRRTQHNSGNVFRGGLTPFIVPPTQSVPYSDTPMTAVSSTFGTSGSHGSGAPVLRNPHSPERPVLTAGIPQESYHGGVYGVSEGALSDNSERHMGVQAVSSSRSGSFEEVRAPVGDGSSSSGESSRTRPLIVINPTVTIQAPVSEKGRLAQQIRSREQRRQCAVIQHEDAEDVLEVPPVYKERA